MKSIMKRAMSYMLSVAVMAGVIFSSNIMAYATESEASSVKKYTITFRSGNVGTFQKDFFVDSADVEVSDYYLKITVAKNTSVGAALAEAFGYKAENGTLAAGVDTLNLLRQSIETEGYAVDLTGIKTATQVKRNCEFVVDYKPLADAIKYVVEYRDADTKEEIAAPSIVYLNKSDIPAAGISVEKKVINHYACNSQNVTIFPKEDEDNIITYYYTYGDFLIEVVGGEVNYVTVETNEPAEVVPATVNGQGVEPVMNEEIAAANEENAEGNEDDSDANENAVANEDEEVNGLTDIDDEDTPLSDGDEKDIEVINYWMIFGIVVAVLIILAFFIMYRTRRTNNIKSEEIENKTDK